MVRHPYKLVFYLISVGVVCRAANSEALEKLSAQLESFQAELNTIQEQVRTLQMAPGQEMSSDDGEDTIKRFTEAIRNNVFDESKIANIVHVIYGLSAANPDVIMAIAEVLSDGDSKIRMLGALRDEMITRGNGDPFRYIALVHSLEKAVSQESNPSPKMKAMGQKLIKAAVEDYRLVVTSILTIAMITDEYQDNAELEQVASAIFQFRSDVSDEVMDRLVDTVFGVVPTKKIIDNISGHRDIPQVIRGLTAVFKRLKSAGELNNDAILDLASNLKKLQMREDYSASSQDLKDDVERIIQQLPTCAKNLFFHTNVCLWNKGRKKYLYAADAAISFDEKRRSIYTWYPGDLKTGAYWFAERDGNDFYFKNRDHTGEYLYASLNHYDKDNRYVFNWIPGNNTSGESAWKVELDGHYCYMKSKLFEEYLYVSDVSYDELNGHVFMRNPGAPERSAEFKWQIRNCDQGQNRAAVTG